ncbi:hypothetical protein BB560_001086 [Smittium megazygosporum]|uniref:Uncharacterized protein n=1 Tax=Smittium megazygosporum TaxID=133381 RepID=A0A2T9ZIS3_9FUNG|nr:hypothetical protein BB560_001086 [Smittium megazygosporum]
MKDNVGNEITTGPYSDFIQGFMYSIYGSFHFLKSKQRAIMFMKEAFWATLGAASLRISLTIVIYLVIQTMFSLSTLIFLSFDFDFAQVADFYNDAKGFLGFLLSAVPFFILEATSRLYFNPFENVFFESLDIFDPYFSKNIQIRKSTRSTYDEMKFLVISSLKRGAIAKLCSSADMIPFVGIVVVPIANYIITYDFYGHAIAGLISLVFFFSSSLDEYAGPYILLCFTIREFAANFLRPYIRRTHLEPYQQVYFFYRNLKLFWGFFIGFYFLSTIPYFGMTFYMLGQAVFALFVAKFVQTEELNVEMEKRGLELVNGKIVKTGNKNAEKVE